MAQPFEQDPDFQALSLDDQQRFRRAMLSKVVRDQDFSAVPRPDQESLVRGIMGQPEPQPAPTFLQEAGRLGRIGAGLEEPEGTESPGLVGLTKTMMFPARGLVRMGQAWQAAGRGATPEEMVPLVTEGMALMPLGARPLMRGGRKPAVQPAARPTAAAAAPTPPAPTTLPPPEQLRLPLTREVPIPPPAVGPAGAMPPPTPGARPYELTPIKTWEGGGLYEPRFGGPYPGAQRELPLTRETPVAPPRPPLTQEALDRDIVPPAAAPVVKPPKADAIGGPTVEPPSSYADVQRVAASVSAQVQAQKPGLAQGTGQWLKGAGQQVAFDQFGIPIRSSDPIAAGMAHRLQRAMTGEAGFRERASGLARKYIAAKAPTDALRREVGILADTDVTPEMLRQVATTNPTVFDAYRNTRRLWSRFADIMKIPQENRLTNYLYHTWDRDQLIAGLQQAAASETNPVLAKLMTDKAGDLAAGTIKSFSGLPREVKVGFLMHRKGMPGYELNVVKAMEKYIDGMARKLYREPVFEAFRTAPPMRPDLQAHLKDLIERYYKGDPEFGALGQIDRVARNAMYTNALGLNPKWGGLVNYPGGQMMNLVELGPTNWVLGGRLLATPEGAHAFVRSGHVASSFIRQALEAAPGANRSRTAQEVFMLLPTRLEYANRGRAWNGRIVEQMMSRGMTFEQVREALRLKQVPRDVLELADDAVRGTQGSYGVANPRWLQLPVIRTLFQFQATPGKMLQTAASWAINNPKKALYLVALHEAWEEAWRVGFGVNLGGAFGVGVDLDTFAKGLVARDPAMLLKAWTDPWSEGRGGMATLGTGPIIRWLIDTYKLGEAGVGMITGKPGSADQATRSVKRMVPLVKRGTRAYETATTGGTPAEAAKQLMNVEAPVSASREHYLREIELGDEDSAARYRRLYDRKNPAAPLTVTREAIMAARLKARDLRREREQYERARPQEERFLESLPPRARTGVR